MELDEYNDRAAEYMRLAVQLMRKHGIALTPANYAVWYEYVAGTNVALQDAVDEHLDEFGQLTDQQSRTLYDRFFDREKDQTALIEMRQDIKRVLSEILSFVSAGKLSSKATSDNLVSIVNKLHPEMSVEEVHEVIEEVIVETRTASSNTDLLTERLNSTINEIQDLKKDLDEAKRDAKTDTLTKLANRKAFDTILETVIHEADSNGSEVCLIFCDIDFFKRINDTHGHLVGDQVLKVVANSLKDGVKGRDLVARYGGEEFVILLLNTSLTNAAKVADTIRKEIASKRIQRKDSRESIGQLTMSFGVARYFPSEGRESFLQRADRALYLSKRNGRNMISEAVPPTL